MEHKHSFSHFVWGLRQARAPHRLWERERQILRVLKEFASQILFVRHPRQIFCPCSRISVRISGGKIFAYQQCQSWALLLNKTNYNLTKNRVLAQHGKIYCLLNIFPFIKDQRDTCLTGGWLMRIFLNNRLLPPWRFLRSGCQIICRATLELHEPTSQFTTDDRVRNICFIVDILKTESYSK